MTKWAVIGIAALAGMGVLSYYATKRAASDLVKFIDQNKAPLGPYQGTKTLTVG